MESGAGLEPGLLAFHPDHPSLDFDHPLDQCQADADPALAEAIEEEMFTFEMLLDLDRQAMGRLLRDVDNEALVDALKGLSDAEREPFFAAMSSRAADGIRDDIDMRGRLARADVLVAQRKIVEVARGLVDQGEIVMGSDNGEFV